MQPTDDSALLRQYAENNSDEAFAALVTRHINLVYSVALRQVGNPHQAGEITQAVFIILARKAASLRDHRALSSWLFQTTRLSANNSVRSEIRRQRREQEAYVQSQLSEPGGEAWPDIAPLLDTAVAGLGEKDRRAILLRYYEGKDLGEVGAALGASDDAAKKRINRAVEKLRKCFTKRGVILPATALTAAVSAHSVQAAPVALAKSATAVAIANGSIAAGSTLTLVDGTMKMMTWLKLKFALGVGVAALLAGGVATVALSQTGGGDKLILNKVVATNRFWLVATPDAVKDYSYVFHLAWKQAPGGFLETPVHITNLARALPSDRQGITYSSVLQRLAKNPERVQVQSARQENGKITLALKFLPIPGEKTTQVINGGTYPVPPLAIECGNGIARTRSHRGYFNTGGTNAVLVIDAEKMVPLSSSVESPYGTVEESFSDYAEVNPGSYAPLSVTVTESNPTMPADFQKVVFAWKFKLHDGLWLFDESQYRGEKVAWTDQVAVNQSPGRPGH
jgi:RNA polymerase sigma factor (sigma-70 family)